MPPRVLSLAGALWLSLGGLAHCDDERAVAGPAGEGVRLWQDASIFEVAHSLLRIPGGVVWVEMYELDRPDLEAALLTAHRRGDDVRLVVDPSVEVSARAASRLRAAGLPVREYPVDGRRHQIDHVKLLLAGGAALLGGMNWGRHSVANHDFALETRLPPLVERLRAVFEQDWALAGGRGRPLPAGSGPVAQTSPNQEIRTLLASGIAAARREVVGEIYTFTDWPTVALLGEAKRRGVRVRILIDARQEANRAVEAALQAAGIPVRRHRAAPGAKLHAKAILFDRARLLVGSANWSEGGLTVNHELDLLTEDRGAAAAFAARFERDWEAGA